MSKIFMYVPVSIG